jgi:hypothetical protein
MGTKTMFFKVSSEEIQAKKEEGGKKKNSLETTICSDKKMYLIPECKIGNSSWD